MATNLQALQPELSALCRRYRVRRLDVFGSAATGKARADSDIDLLVEFEPMSEGYADAYFGLQGALQTLLRKLDAELLIPALRAATDELRDKLLAAMPQRAAEALRDEMDNRGPVKVDEAATAQKSIASAARKLASEGSISLPGKGPAYV